MKMRKMNDDKTKITALGKPGDSSIRVFIEETTLEGLYSERGKIARRLGLLLGRVVETPEEESRDPERIMLKISRAVPIRHAFSFSDFNGTPDDWDDLICLGAYRRTIHPVNMPGEDETRWFEENLSLGVLLNIAEDLPQDPAELIAGMSDSFGESDSIRLFAWREGRFERLPGAYSFLSEENESEIFLPDDSPDAPEIMDVPYTPVGGFRSGGFPVQAETSVEPKASVHLVGMIERGEISVSDLLEKYALQIFIEASAMERIQTYTRSHGHNESGGLILGTFGFDPETRRSFIMITEQIPALSAVGSTNRLSFSAETYHQMLVERDQKFPDLRILGWYHSHPDHGVFFSKEDQFIHNCFFGKPYQVGLVYDNIKDRTGAFRWERNIVRRASLYRYLKIEC